jgi:hypothetical protein
MTKVVWSGRIRLAGVLLLAGLLASCGELTRQGTASSYLIVMSLQAASGADPGAFGGTLSSDVITVVDDVPTVFSDPGNVTFRLGLKDPAGAVSPANWITVERYTVAYTRTDGRNTPGVEVPYPIDGAVTATVSADAEIGFTIVRIQAKLEAPLKALASGGPPISTIAEVTFYGHDQTGRAVSVTGRIGVTFANFGDPE